MKKGRTGIGTRIGQTEVFQRTVDMTDTTVLVLSADVSADKVWARIPADAGMRVWLETGDDLNA